MDYREVKSSSIKMVGYDSKTLELEIEFNSGGIYRYAQVLQSLANGLLNSESKGMYFTTEIRGKFQYRCLKPAPRKEPDATTEPTNKVEAAPKKPRRKAQPI